MTRHELLSRERFGRTLTRHPFHPRESARPTQTPDHTRFTTTSPFLRVR